MDNNAFRRLLATNGLNRGYPRRRRLKLGRLLWTVVILVFAFGVVGTPWFDFWVARFLG